MLSTSTQSDDDLLTIFAMRTVNSETFDSAVLQAPGDDLRCVYLWGTGCFNCGLFKQAARLHAEELRALPLTWFEADVYGDPALGRRFGLHGVPAFFMFRGGKRLGRITGWPGHAAFIRAVLELEKEAAGS